MISHGVVEEVIEAATIEWLQKLGYIWLRGPEIAPGEPGAERDTYAQVVLEGRLRSAIERLNPGVPTDAIETAMRKVLHPEASSLLGANRDFHRMLVDGVEVEYQRPDGSIKGDRLRLMDFDKAKANDWLVVNQFTIVEGGHNRRPDVILFVNGLPLAVIELKNATDENATIWSAFNQLQTYKAQISSLFTYNAALVISDGMQARIGSLTADRERFMPWRTIEGEELASANLLQMEVVTQGVFEPSRFLDLIKHFIVFEETDAGVPVKKIAGYHQFHAVRRAVAATIEAARPDGDRRAGVVWHTQGSGKSLTMAFYTGRVVLAPEMENPTVVVLTDRNDLDDQLFGTFARCHELLRQTPVQAKDRAHLRQVLAVASGGVVFTTIQKFSPDEKGDRFPLLSDRRNIIVMADEAHRSQYDFIDGFARHMRDALPNASFIGFTGTPIETTDKNTQAVFGDHISIYDIQRAVEDGATVPIYYESRLAKLELKQEERPNLDAGFEEATEGEELTTKEKLKTKWAAMEALVGTEKRLALIAKDIVNHWEARQSAMDGKGMIVCMSRRICVDLYKAIVKLRPDWGDADETKGAIKVVMTGSASDPEAWQPHIHNKATREMLAKRAKDPNDPLKLVIVRDMWLTGFDAPSMHTMYVDKPMRSHGLMQAIARVNRVYKDKPGGLIVDYLGLADLLKEALANYTENGGKGQTAIDQNEAVAAMLERYEVCCNMFHGFDYSTWLTGTPAQRLGLLPAAQNLILGLDDGKSRFMTAVTQLSQAFALAVPHDETLRIRDEVGFFQAVRAALAKSEGPGQKTKEDLDYAVRQLVSQAVTSGEMIDIFSAAGLKKPNLSVLSDEFLAEVRGLPHKNLAVELLRKLLAGEIMARKAKSVVQGRSFADMLAKRILAYQNRAIETAQVIDELIQMAKELREADRRGEQLGLTEDEVHFYEALEVNDSAVKLLGDDVLKAIAKDLVDTVKRNVTIDWSVKETARAKLRSLVKRVLRKHGYPPDKQEQATNTVLEQAVLLCNDWEA